MDKKEEPEIEKDKEEARETEEDDDEESVLNVNVGLLGHVDSGKTTLARALSSEASTAAFDKSPQSRARGITLDLGFSAFRVRAPVPRGVPGFPRARTVQFTLVDCPGHASLVRTIIGGAQTVDTLLLVVDATRGFQPQTAEGLVLGTLTAGRLVVALTKTDLLAPATRAAALARATARVAHVLARTRFAGAPVVPVCARSGGPNGMSSGDSGDDKNNGIAALREALLASVDARVAAARARARAAPLLVAVDHCFAVRGQGTVATGTVLRGRVAPGDTVAAGAAHTPCRVRSLQVFRRPVARAAAGDRVGIGLAGLAPAALERGLLAAPGTLPVAAAVVGRAHRVPWHRAPCRAKTKFHVTIGHCTVLATVHFCRRIPPDKREEWVPDAEYEYLDELPEDSEGEGESEGEGDGGGAWTLLELEQPVPCPEAALFIAAHLDADTAAGSGGSSSVGCRFAFHGHVAACFATAAAMHAAMRVFTLRTREGTVERAVDARTAIARGLCKREAAPTPFLGLTVTVPGYAPDPALTARIDSPFGKSGKFKVVFSRDVTARAITGQKIVLTYKKYRFARHDKLVQ